MTTNTNAQSTDITPTASEVRQAHIFVNGSTPLVPITGNTFPIRKLMWVLGGTWNKETKCWELPMHTAKKGQEAADSITEKIAASKMASEEKKVAKALASEVELKKASEAELKKAKRSATARANLVKARAAKATKALVAPF